MRSFFKKYGLLLGIVIIVLIILLFVVIFMNSKQFDDSVLEVNHLQSDVITINNTLPMTDEVGKNMSIANYEDGFPGYLEFEVKSTVNDSVKYEVYLSNEVLDNEIPVKFVKIYLTDENDIVFDNYNNASVPTYYDLRVADSDPSGKLLYSGTLKKKGNQKFKLRMWVADTYELIPDVREFSVKLNVKVN